MIAKMLQRKTAATGGGGGGPSVPTPTVYWEADYGIVTTTNGTTADASPVSGNKVLSWTSKDASASVASYSVNSQRPTYFAPSGSMPYVRFLASGSETLETTAFVSTFNNANQYSMGVLFRKMPAFTAYHNQIFLAVNSTDNAGSLTAQGGTNTASIFSGGVLYLGGTRVIVSGPSLPTGVGTLFGSFSTTSTSATVAASSNTRLYYNGILVASDTASNATLNYSDKICLNRFVDPSNSINTEVFGFYLYSTQLSDTQITSVHNDCFSRFNPYTALPVSGAALWLDATQQSSLFTDAGVTNATTDGQAVYQWNDLSGNNRTALQTTLANRPLYRSPASGHNGLGGTSYNGSNQFFTVSNTIGWNLVYSGDFTIDIIHKASSTGGCIFGQDNGGGVVPKWMFCYGSNSPVGSGFYGFHYNGGGFNGNVRVAWTPTANQVYRFTAVRSGNDHYFYINGVQQGSVQTTASRPGNPTVNATVGQSGENYAYVSTPIYEVSAYLFAMNSTQLGLQSAYSLAKWGVS